MLIRYFLRVAEIDLHIGKTFFILWIKNWGKIDMERKNKDNISKIY